MGNIKHRLPVLNGKTDKENISQLSDSLFQLIRELNLGENETKPTESGEVIADNVPNKSVNNSAEIGALKTNLEEVVGKVSGMEEVLESTAALLESTATLTSQLKNMMEINNGTLNQVNGRPYIAASGKTLSDDGTMWNYTKWSNGELEYWRIITYKPSTTFSGVRLCSGPDKYYPTSYKFKEVPALSVSAYALGSAVRLIVDLEGLSEDKAKEHVPAIHVNTKDGTNISGLICTIYARGRTA